MSTRDEKTAIEALCANALNVRFKDLDKATVELAKNRVIDVIGCAIGGANAPGNAALRDLVKGWGGKKESAILVHGGKAPAHNVAMLNAIMARSYDFEVMSLVADGRLVPSHHAATMVTAALAVAQAAGADGKEMLTAMVVGDDVAARVLVSSDWNFYLGWDGIGTVVSLGAVATAGRLLGLDEVQMRNAFGILVNLICGSIQSIWDGATTFKLNQGAAARDGIFAAELARGGWTGLSDALFSRFGYFHLYTQGCKDPAFLTRDLGRKFYGESDFKPYPCGFPNHAPIDCALELVREYGVKAGDIEGVEVKLLARSLLSYYAKPFAIRDFPHGDAIFSFYYTVATALLRGSVKPEHFTEESIRDPRVNELIKKIKLSEIPAGKDVARVELKMKDGRELAKGLETGKGNPLTKPLSQEEILGKFRSQVEYSKTVSWNKAEKLLEMLGQLEKVDDLDKLTALATASRRPKK
jgi:2-methylcitrate dehydratase PrpD